MKIVNKLWDKMVNMTPTQKIATSLILKDAVGCCLYVSQARSNKEFTPKQRSDVANYDLANGVINIALQLLAVKPIENIMTKVVDSKMMKKMFNNLDERLADVDNQKVMKLLKQKKNLTAGIVALFSVIICQYFIKRVVSPFLSVPAGEKSKELGFVKPKLYEGETYNPKPLVELDKVKKTVVNTYETIEGKFEDSFEKIEDKFESFEDKFKSSKKGD